MSYGGGITAAFAERDPGRVRRVVTFGAYARRADVAPAEVRASLLAMVRAHWGLGSRMLADVWLPDGDAAERAELTDYQRAAATPEMAAALLELADALDARASFERLRQALVLSPHTVQRHVANIRVKLRQPMRAAAAAAASRIGLI